MKYRLILLCMVMACLMILPLGALAAQAGDFYYTVANDHAAITGYSGPGGEVVIPDTIQGLPVTVIGESAFEYCESITAVTLPSGLKMIDNWAFNGCPIETVNIPDGLESIGYCSFNSYTICYASIGSTGAKTLSWYGYTFVSPAYPSLRLQYAYDGEAVTGLNAWALTTEITEATIPAQVTRIVDNGFANCVNLTAIEIPDTVLDIGGNAFYNCTSLTSVTLPSGLEEISGWTFGRCDSLTGIELPASVTVIGESAFEYCVSLSSVTLPSGLKRIDSWAFNGCPIETVDIPDGLEFIGYSSVNGDTLCYASIGSSGAQALSRMGYPFVSTAYPSLWLRYVFEDEAVSGLDAWALNTEITEVTIPAQVTRIVGTGFADCGNLTAIEIPDTVREIGGSAFAGCTSLTSVTLPSGLEEISGWLFASCGSLTDVDLPAGVTVIGESAFEYCGSLSSIELPAGLKRIYSWAFNGCPIETVNIPDGLEDIGYCSFNGDTRCYASIGSSGAITLSANGYTFVSPVYPSLWLQYEFENGAVSGLNVWVLNKEITEVTIPAQVTRIADAGFADCLNLTAIEIPDTVLEIGGSAFFNCPALTSVTLPSGLEEISGWMFSCCGSLTDVDLPAGVTVIGESAFEYCGSLSSIELPAGLKRINSWAFNGCPMETVNIPDGLEDIGYCSFNGDTRCYASIGSSGAITLSANSYSFISPAYPSLWLQYVFENGAVSGLNAWALNTEITEATIPAQVTRIVDAGFAYCGNLTAIVIPDTVLDIGGNAFYNCTGLTSVTLPSGLQEISNWMFSSCGSLTGIVLPADITAIGESAFEYCGSLSTITLPAGLKRIGSWAFNGCPMETVNIPDGLEEIGYCPFNGDTICCASIGSNGAKTLSRSGYSFVSPAYPSLGLQYVFVDEAVTGLNAWALNTEITEAAIPAQVTHIVDSGFAYCGNLTAVVIPDTVLEIGRSAFTGCTGLTSVTLPSGLEEISNWMFSGCGSLTDVDLPASVTVIGESAFENCQSLSSIVLPAGLKRIGSWAFYGCPTETMSIPDGLEEIGYCSLNDNTICYASIGSSGAKTLSSSGYSFVSPAYPNVRLQYDYDSEGAITGLRAWALNAEITEAVIPPQTTALARSAFSNCDSLTAIAVPGSIAHISDYAFYHCDSLTNVTLASGVQSIGDCAFWECFGGLTVDIPNSVTSVHEYAFPRANETLVVGCIFFARDWAAGQGYVRDTLAEEGDLLYRVRHNEMAVDPAVAPTCEETGLTQGSHCEACHEVVIPQETVPALGHDWKTPTYTWNADHTSVTATRVCGRDGSHVETETVGAASAVTTAPTCTKKGKTTYTSEAFTNPAFTVQSVTLTDIPALGHDWKTPTYSWSADHAAVTAKRVCTRSSSHVEKETVGATSAVTTAPTCTKKGKTTYTSAAFTNPAFTVQSVTVTDIPALGHDWKTPTYTWNADHTAVTAKHVCTRSSSHVETETAQATAAVTTPATCETMGITTYTSAAFTNPAFTVQSVTLTDIPALGHDWQAPTYTWSEDHCQVTGKRVCANNAAHQETETAPAAYAVTLSPTDDAPGQRTFTSAAFANSAFSVQQIVVEDLPALNTLLALRLPAGLKTIGAEAFEGCVFQCVIIPEGCTAIGSLAFANCSRLVYVLIPSSVTTIADDAFLNSGAVIIDRK